MKKIKRIAVLTFVLILVSSISITTKSVEAVNTKEVYIIKVTASAYCPCNICCGKSDGITKTGAVAKQGRTIAVDPSVIALGSVVKIDGKEYIAQDTGGSIKGYKIDLFFENHNDAKEYGIKMIEIEIN